MNDKKQIEEMAQDIASNCPDLVENCCGNKPCYVCIAERLAKENYRKLPKNAVVLSREENEKWLHFLELNMNKARKETAREILQDLYSEATSNISETVELTTFQIEQLAMRYSVDLGE